MRRKSNRLYSLFRVVTPSGLHSVNARKQYVRIDDNAYTLEAARRIYQDRLLCWGEQTWETRELRPVAR